MSENIVLCFTFVFAHARAFQRAHVHIDAKIVCASLLCVHRRTQMRAMRLHLRINAKTYCLKSGPKGGFKKYGPKSGLKESNV